MTEKIRELLAKHGGLSVAVDQIADDADLYAAGMSSFASVQIMLAIEEAFDLEFPDTLLNRKSFQSIAAITRAVEGLVRSAEAAE
ncbi:MAG TPA: acyl carrier protein [Mycoplana sp.]|nr:acyl carrier protein [Mycoplana sp.]